MLCRKAFALRQKIQKAFVHGQHRTHGFAFVQQRFHKGRLCQLAGGVVGLTEEHHICTRVHRVQEILRHRKIVFFPQKMPFHRAACRFKGGGILGKSGGRYQCSAGLCSQRQPEDEVCRAVAAQQPFGGHSLSHRQFFTQGPAQRVGVAVGRGKRCRNGLCHAFRQAQRTDIGRKIQRVAAKLGAVARPVAAMGQLFHARNPRIAAPHASAKPLATYIMRLARRMSCGSMGRRASPMVGLG